MCVRPCVIANLLIVLAVQLCWGGEITFKNANVEIRILSIPSVVQLGEAIPVRFAVTKRGEIEPDLNCFGIPLQLEFEVKDERGNKSALRHLEGFPASVRVDPADRYDWASGETVEFSCDLADVFSI